MKLSKQIPKGKGRQKKVTSVTGKKVKPNLKKVINFSRTSKRGYLDGLL